MTNQKKAAPALPRVRILDLGPEGRLELGVGNSGKIGIERTLAADVVDLGGDGLEAGVEVVRGLHHHDLLG